MHVYITLNIYPRFVSRYYVFLVHVVSLQRSSELGVAT